MVLRFNGIDMPIPKQGGFTITRNKVWSTNAGRNANGDMVGTILAKKAKGEIEWPPMTPDKVAMIDSIVSDISNPYPTVEFTNEKGESETIAAYFGDATYPVYSMNAMGKMILSGVKCDFIEQ